VKIHIRKEYLNKEGKLDTQKLDLVGRMGGIYYNRASGDALFQIPKPLATPGIGIDSLPDHIKNSDILSTNELARLAGIDSMPTENELFKSKSSAEFRSLAKDYGEDKEQFISAVHYKAKDMLASGKIKEALGFLLSIIED